MALDLANVAARRLDFSVLLRGFALRKVQVNIHEKNL